MTKLPVAYNLVCREQVSALNHFTIVTSRQKCVLNFYYYRSVC